MTPLLRLTYVNVTIFAHFCIRIHKNIYVYIYIYIILFCVFFKWYLVFIHFSLKLAFFHLALSFWPLSTLMHVNLQFNRMIFHRIINRHLFGPRLMTVSIVIINLKTEVLGSHPHWVTPIRSVIWGKLFNCAWFIHTGSIPQWVILRIKIKA